ncbi:hypothetical protein STEG23_002106, partial [Scotinomys teguina]
CTIPYHVVACGQKFCFFTDSEDVKFIRSHLEYLTNDGLASMTSVSQKLESIIVPQCSKLTVVDLDVYLPDFSLLKHRSDSLVTVHRW